MTVEKEPEGRSFNHKAASYAVSALVIGFIAKPVSTALPATISNALSVPIDILFFSAFPAGIIALLGIWKHGTPGLLWKGLLGVLIPPLMFVLSIAIVTMLRNSIKEQEMSPSFAFAIKALNGTISFLTAPGFALTVGILALFYYLFRRSRKNSDVVDPAVLLSRAMQMEKSGHAMAALVSYDHIAKKYSQMPVARDAQVLADTLRSKSKNAESITATDSGI